MWNPPVTSRGILALVLPLVLVILLQQARAAIHFVPSGQSIENAANQAADGDTVILEPGTHTETVVLANRSLTIASRYVLSGDTSDIAATVLLAEETRPDTASCLVLSGTPLHSYRVVGLTLLGGTGTLFIYQGQHYNHGGGVWVQSAGATVEYCRISECTAGYGGGIAVGGTSSQDTASARIAYCEIGNCSATLEVGFENGGYGGGIWCEYYESQVVGVRVRNCQAQLDGGGIYVANEFLLDSCLIQNCLSDWSGGVVGATTTQYYRPARIRNCQFLNNGTIVPSHGAWCHLFTQGNVIVSGSVFSGNATQNPAIAMSDFNDQFNGIGFFVGNVVENHVLDEPVTNGLVYFFDCRGHVKYNIFRDNSGAGGGTVLPTGSGILTTIRHNVFRNNLRSQGSSDEWGAAVFVNASVNNFRIDSNLFAGNDAPAIGYDSLFIPTQIRAENNWWGDASGPYHPDRNPEGQGDTLLGSVIDFEPWLTAPPDTITDAVTRPVVTSSSWELLHVYPNPFNGELMISVAGIMGADFSLKLFDILGREIDTLHKGRSQGQMIHYRAPDSLASGIYFVQAADRRSVKTVKVVFMK